MPCCATAGWRPEQGQRVKRVLVIYQSEYGHTRVLAERLACGAKKERGVTATLVPVAEALDRLPELDAADALVFGCPTYMGNVPAAFKAFMDGTSVAWQEQRWRDKLAAGFTNSASPSGDKLATLQQLVLFAAQHGMLWVSLGLPPADPTRATPASLNRLGGSLGALAQSENGPPTESPPEGDRATAECLGQRVARLCLQRP